jgi:nicotinamidase-related amidase
MNGISMAPLAEGPVKADPYPWPYDGNLSAANTALIIIDMQTDFCGRAAMSTRWAMTCLSPAPRSDRSARSLLDAARVKGITSFTPAKAIVRISRTCRPTSAGARSDRRGHRRSRALRQDPGAWRAGLGDHRELAPATGEPIIDKPGKGSFCATDLEMLLHVRGIRNIILTGITTDVCVHTTMREANDRGFECLMVEDCCGATNSATTSRHQDGQDAGRGLRRRGIERSRSRRAGADV